MAYKNTQLVPVKRMVHRQGQAPFEMTVWVKAYNMKKVKDGVTKVEIPTSDWAKIKTVDDFLKLKDTIFNNEDVADKEVLKAEFIEFLSKCGVTWQRDKDLRQDWMRCAIATKKAIKDGSFFVPDGTSIKPKAKATPYVKLPKADARKLVTQLSKELGSKKLVELIEKEGIPFAKNDQDYINTMHACMALREHLEKGNGFSPINDKLEKNPEYKEEGKVKEKKLLTAKQISYLANNQFGKLKKPLVMHILRNGWKIEEIPDSSPAKQGYHSKYYTGYRVTNKDGVWVDVINDNGTTYYPYTIHSIDTKKWGYSYKSMQNVKEYLTDYLGEGEPINHDYIKDEPKDKKEKKQKGEFKTHVHKMYHEAPKLSKVLACITGIVPEGEEATNFLKNLVLEKKISNPIWTNPASALKIHKNFKAIFESERTSSYLKGKFSYGYSTSWGRVCYPLESYKKHFENAGMLKEYTDYQKACHEYEGSISRTLFNLSSFHVNKLHKTLDVVNTLHQKGIISMKNETTGIEHMFNLSNLLLNASKLNDDEAKHTWNLLGMDDYLARRPSSPFGSPMSLLSELATRTLGESNSVYSEIGEMYSKQYGAIPNGVNTIDYVMQHVTSKQELFSLVGNALLSKYEKVQKEAQGSTYNSKYAKDYLDNFHSQRVLQRFGEKRYNTDWGSIIPAIVCTANNKDKNAHANWSYPYDDDNCTFNIDKCLNVVGGMKSFRDKHFENDTTKYIEQNLALLHQIKEANLTSKQEDTILANYKLLDKQSLALARTNNDYVPLLTEHIYVHSKSEKQRKNAQKQIDKIKSGDTIESKQAKLVELLSTKGIDGISDDDIPTHQNVVVKNSIHPMSKDALEKLKAQVWESDLNNKQKKHSHIDMKIHNAFVMGNMPYHDDFTKWTQKENNEKMLFHGTSFQSMQGILGISGQWNAGKSMVKAGRMLGDGVYFASQAKKASQYLGKNFGKAYGTRGCMFLCKVSRGKQKDLGYWDANYTACENYFRQGFNTVECTQATVNPEWCVKNTQSFVPQILMDMEIVKAGEGNCKEVYEKINKK